MYRPTTLPALEAEPSRESEALALRSTREVIEDHIQLQIAGELDGDLQRNYAPDAVILKPGGCRKMGHAALRAALSPLYRQGPGSCFEMIALEVFGNYALLVWKARGPDYAVDCAADSFLVIDGAIHMQTSHHRLLEPAAVP